MGGSLRVAGMSHLDVPARKWMDQWLGSMGHGLFHLVMG